MRKIYVYINDVVEVNYGLLYNWYAATNVLNIANIGWKVPTYVNFQTLSTYLGGDTVAGGKLKKTGLIYWTTPNTNATNEVSFNAVGAGMRSGTLSNFLDFNDLNYFWTNDNYSPPSQYFISLFYNTDAINTWQATHQRNGHSVRLLKTSTALSNGEEGTYTGNDGKTYRTICIGTQEWLSDNLCETKYRDGSTIPEVTVNASWIALTTGALCAYNNDWTNV